MSDSFQQQVPDWLNLPPAEVQIPITVTAPQLLPFASLTPENFERLVLRLARRNGDVEHAQLYGTRGQDQHGIDLYCRLAAPDDDQRRYLTIQCRNVATLGAAQLRGAVEDFQSGLWAERTRTFVFATRASAVRSHLAEAVEAAAAGLATVGIRFEIWDAEHLSDRLRNEPELVALFFGLPTAELFCGPPSFDAGALPTVGSVTDIALLRVHPAIPLAVQEQSGLDRDLPSYVLRDVDAPVREALSSMADTGGFLLLVGRAAAGKTRLAYEAVKAVLADWRLCSPTSASDVAGLARADLGQGKIVVWLDDLERFLDHGQLSASVIQRLMTGVGRPVVLVGTIWPEHYDRLRAHGGQDEARTHLQREAREVLRLARRFDVASDFTRAETLRAQETASTDPRLNEALAHVGVGSPTAVLACAPELVHRLRQASDSAGAAVLRAAVDIRLCGHAPVIPASLLEQIAGRYLSTAERARASQDWFSAAVRWATTPVRGSISALTPYASTIGQVDGYEISDILVSDTYDSPEFSHRDIPAITWDALAADAADLRSIEAIGVNATMIGMIEIGRRALNRAVDAGSTIAYGVLGFSYFDDGNLPDALRCFQQHHDLGHEDIASMLAVVHDRLGDKAQARSWLTRAVAAGELAAMYGLANLLEEEGDLDGARTWYQRGADLGFAPAMTGLAGLLRDEGHHETSMMWMHRAAEAGEPKAMMNLALDLWRTGDADGAERWFREAAVLGEVVAMEHLAQVLGESEQFDEAARWARRAVEAGHESACLVLAMMLVELDDFDQAEEWLRRGAAAGDPNCLHATNLMPVHADRTETPREARLAPTTEEINWTPLAHRCRCVVDWGWSARTGNPMVFMEFCMGIPLRDCPWHGPTPSGSADHPADVVLELSDPHSGGTLYFRRAHDTDVELGWRLNAELNTLGSLIVDHDVEGILASAPPELVTWYEENGYDPAEEWVTNRLADILLNRGQIIDWQKLVEPLSPM